MALFEGKTPSERNKLMAAMVLGALALVALSYMFFGSSSTPKRTQNTNARAAGATQTTTSVNNTTTTTTTAVASPDQVRKEAELAPPRPIVFEMSSPAVPEPGRNIFSFYIPPPPAPKASPTPIPPPPVIPPSLVLSGVTPTNVYARTGDFTIQLTGDKFTPAVRIYFGDAELATHFVSAQQLSANVPAPLIGYEGARQISVRTSDGSLFSNTATLNVMAAPVPNYSFVGIIGDKRYSDTAILKDKNTKQLLNVQRGDIIGGRFRVTSISEREVLLTDTSIRIKHTLTFEGGDNAGGRGVPPVPQPPRSTEDDGDEAPVLEEP